MLAHFVCAVTNSQPRAGQLTGGKCFDACFSLGICSVKRQTDTSQSNVQGQVCEACMPHNVSEGSSLCLSKDFWAMRASCSRNGARRRLLRPSLANEKNRESRW